VHRDTERPSLTELFQQDSLFLNYVIYKAARFLFNLYGNTFEMLDVRFEETANGRECMTEMRKINIVEEITSQV